LLLLLLWRLRIWLLRSLRVGMLRRVGLAVLLLLGLLWWWRLLLLLLRRVKGPGTSGTGWLLVRLLINNCLLLLGLRRSRKPVRGRVGRGALLLRIHRGAVLAARPMVVICLLER
jgi:hypothetical protein